MPTRTAKTCGPDASMLASSWRINPRNDGGKKADHRGEHGISRKPLRGECRVIPVTRCEYSCAYLLPQRTRGCGCIGHPAFPAPSDCRGRNEQAKPRAKPAARSRSCVERTTLPFTSPRLRGEVRKPDPRLQHGQIHYLPFP